MQGLGEADPNAYIYFITQAPVWEAICYVIGKPEWKTDPDYAKPPARLPRLKHIFVRSNMDHDQDQVRGHGHLQAGHPCGPILSMKEIAEEQSLRGDRYGC